MKKLTLLFALLCVSVMGWAIAEDTYIGTTDPTYANQFKWYSVPGQTAPQEVVNIQPGTNGIALYVNVGTDLFDGVNYNGVAVATADLEDYYAKSGAGAWFYLSQFTTKCTTIEVTNSGTVIRAFRVQNDNEIGDACGTGGGDPTPDPAPEDIDWNSVSFVPGSTQYKVGALSASNLPNEVINVQKPGWAEEQGIYMTFPSADQLSCSVDAAISGAGMVVYLSDFQNATETEVTVNWNVGSRTFYVYNNSLMTLPATKAASPAIAASNVRAVYSQYTLNTGMTRYGWSDGTTQNVIVDGRRFPSYKITNQLGLGIGRTNVSMMNKLHLDVWAESSFDINVCLISDGAGEHNQTVSLTGNQWNSVNLSLDDFQATKTAVTAIKLSSPSVSNQLFFLDNIYFYSESDLPDPDPTDVYDTNFALLSNGGIAYPSTHNGENFAARAIDGDNGTQWESVQGSDPQTWTVDLGQRRIFNILQIRWEAAYARAFTISISNDAISWTQVAEETNYTTGGNNVEYQIELGENKTARYIRFTGTARATGYGYSFREFRVFLTGTPVLTSVGIASDKELVKVGEYTTLTASPKDQNNSPIAADLSYSVSPSDLGHVTEGKYYPDKYGLATITVTAEAGGVQVTNNVQIWGVTSTNLAKDNALSDDGTYTSDGGSDHLPAKAVDGLNNTWWQGSTNGESGAADDEARTYDAYFTIDLGGIYNLQLVRIIFDGACSDKYKLKVSANNSDWADAYTYDQVTGNHAHTKYIAAADMNNSDNVRYFKFYSTKASTQWGVKIYELEVYGTEASTTKTVSASVNPASTGSVTVMAGDPLVAVTEVASGTPVTFTATPAEGYDFINWTQGGVEVSTSAEYVPTITSNTSLVANFELKRTPYCGTPLTDTQGRVLYLTISKTENENEYKILLEGSVNNKIVGNNVYVGTGLRMRNVNGVFEYHFSNAGGIWHVTAADEHSYGSAYVTFTATDFREISFVNKGIDLYRDMSGGGGDLSSFNAFPDANLIKWDATCADAEAPVLAAPVATPLSGTSVRLALSATDNMAALLTYSITYEGLATPIEVPGAAGETTYYNVKGLSAGTSYTFFVTVSDGTNVSAAQSCSATPSMPTAPVPAHEAVAVRSVYSDTYESALAHDFIKNNWSWAHYSEQNIGGNHLLVYTSDPSIEVQMPDVAWGADNDGETAIIAKDGYNDGINKGLDVRSMTYIHFDIWSAVATNYPELRLNDTEAGHIVLDGSGWQSFDIDITGLTDEQKTNIRWIKFIALRTPNPEEIAIDNVYFWKEPDITRDDSWMAPGELGTICIPQGAVATGGDIYELKGKNSDGKIVFATVTNNEMEPGKPYLFEAKSNAMKFYYTAETPAVEPDNSGAMKGSFTSYTLYDLDNVYYFAGHALWSCDDLTELNVIANRAYVKLDEVVEISPAPVPGRRFVYMDVHGPNTTTGVDELNASETPVKVIIDGKLFILRGEKMYDVTGSLVK